MQYSIFTVFRVSTAKPNIRDNHLQINNYQPIKTDLEADVKRNRGNWGSAIR